MSIDVNLAEHRTVGKKYTLAARIVQTAATVADTTVFAVRNTGTKDWHIHHFDVTLAYGSSTPTSLIKGYVLQRFSAATPTGGTALTPAPNDSNDAALACDARFVDTGLTMTNVSFGSIFSYFLRDTGYASTAPSMQEWPDDAHIVIHPGEGLCMRIANVTMEAQFAITLTAHIVEV